MWNFNYTYPLELRHYGVKGMKWGIRRTRQELDRVYGPRTSNAHNEALNNKKVLVAKAGDLRYNERKLTGYILNIDHPKGGPKARFLRDVLGYTSSDAKILHKRIVDALTDRIPDTTVTNEYGTKYTYYTKLSGVDGKNQANVKIAIQMDNMRSTCKVVTIVPGKKEK